ncbi:MAG: 1-acyl-sn-glycerol-3-phosphate acyltransferase [Planctomycetota bacterium]
MRVVIEKPYQFVPPHRGNWWPSCIQTFRLIDLHLRFKEGITRYELRGHQHLKDSLAAGHGILLTPNHCRYADPIAMGWPARHCNTHVFAIASWHLFCHSKFQSYAIQKMGGFSLWREGVDRKSLETAIDILAGAARPLIVFPEGTSNMTNDVLQPLMEGTTFIARSAARRRKKTSDGTVVMHPVAIKYLFTGDIQAWATPKLRALESHLDINPATDNSLPKRSMDIFAAAMQQIATAAGTTLETGGWVQQRDALIDFELRQIESKYDIAAEANIDSTQTIPRVRTLRTKISPTLIDPQTPADRRSALRDDLLRVDQCQWMRSFPESYAPPHPVTDTQLIETIQRLQQFYFDKPDSPSPLTAIIEIDSAIPVPATKAPKAEADPLLLQLEERMGTMLNALAKEANVLT